MTTPAVGPAARLRPIGSLTLNECDRCAALIANDPASLATHMKWHQRPDPVTQPPASEMTQSRSRQDDPTGKARPR